MRPAVPGNNAARMQTLENELAKIVSEMLYLGATPQIIINQIKTQFFNDEGGKKDD